MPKIHKDVPIDEFTTPIVHTVQKDTSLNEIKKLMDTEGIRHIPVVHDNVAIGIISDRDLKLITGFNSSDQLTAKDVMVSEPFSANCNSSLEEVVFEMSRQKIGSAIIQDDDGKVYGIFTSTDALNALVEVLRGDV